MWKKHPILFLILLWLFFVFFQSAEVRAKTQAQEEQDDIERFVSIRSTDVLFVSKSNNSVTRKSPRIDQTRLPSDEYQLHDLSADEEYAIISVENKLFCLELSSSLEPVLLYDNFFYDRRSYYEPDHEPHAIWIENDNKIAFIGWHYDKKELFIVKPDGTDLKQITNLRKDFDFLAFSVENQIYWIETGVYRNRLSNRTNLNNGITVPIDPSYIYDFYPSPDGEKSILMIYSYMDIIDPLLIHIQTRNREKNRLISPTSMELQWWEGFSRISNVWWGPDNDNFILEIELEGYYLFNSQGEFLGELIYEQ